MPLRRKTHLPLTEMTDEDIGLECAGDPIYSGDATGDEDLVCGRCHRTLFLALSRDGVFAAIAKSGLPSADRRGRRYPLVAICDCEAVNRVWPPVLD